MFAAAGAFQMRQHAEAECSRAAGCKVSTRRHIHARDEKGAENTSAPSPRTPKRPVLMPAAHSVIGIFGQIFEKLHKFSRLADEESV